ncbi:hypothetical protein B0H11DRAFT_271887 [Mycena galericulata]|nr:hypothetical protein B0H11DRAFT_271887 [Mycena galericulata]
MHCAKVCREWQDIVKDSTELRYTIELWADGMNPGPSAELSPVEKLERLYHWRRAWRDIDWTSRTVFPIDTNPRAYELVGGVFAQQNTWPQSDFTAIRLPCSAQHSGQVQATANIGIQSLDFAMDPTQDLVIFLHKDPDPDEIGNFDCRSLSSGGLRPHPLASAPRLSFDLRDDTFQRIFLQIADDVVGLLFRTSQREGSLRLVLFNWRTGTQLVDLTGPQFPHSVGDFALLSPRAYILASVNDTSYMPGRPRGIGEIHIYTFDGTRAIEPTRVAILQLPHPHPHRHLNRIVAHSGPFCAGPLPGVTFSKRNDRRICVISLEYDQGECYFVYVPHRYLETYVGLPDSDDGPPTVLWDEWGPKCTRMLPGRHRFWLRYVHGERVVCSMDPEHPNRVGIMDFGITPSRPGFNDEFEASRSPNIELFTQPSTIPSLGTTFKNDIMTALPYRTSFRDLEEESVLFLIDQDRIIGVNDAVDKLTVYTF